MEPNHNKCAFTIVAKNYIGLAQILEKSLRRQDGDVDFLIFVADEFSEACELPCNALVARRTLDIPDALWTDMSFKYNLTEFCTSIKPKCFEYVLGRGYDKAVYFDPDIYIFSSVSGIFDRLDAHDIVLTPHIALPHVRYGGDLAESALFGSGVFNLGFCALRAGRVASVLLQWWHERLIDKCFVDKTHHYFTDQKWMDMLPCMFGPENLRIERGLGYNLAPWNFFEREVVKRADGFGVKPRGGEGMEPLVFVHYSGYDYKGLTTGSVAQKNIVGIREYPDILPLLEAYGSALLAEKETFCRYIDRSYSYNCFTDGTPLDIFKRRVYHGLCESGAKFADPFDANGVLFRIFRKAGMLVSRCNTDRMNRHTVQNVAGKKRWLDRLFRVLYRTVGYDRYVLFVKSLSLYSRMEMHTFLLGRKSKKH